MPNCKSYQQLTPLEKSLFIGQLQHSAQSNEVIFDLCQDIIAMAIMKGIFDNVEIMPLEKVA